MKTDANEAIIIILLALSVAWVVCSIICLLKGKYGMARSVLAFGGAMRLAHPESYYANWFYRRNLHKYWRAVERFGMIQEYATMIAGNIELSREFESFLRRKLTPEQRLGGLKTTEAAEFAKLTRIGRDAYLAEKKAEIEPKLHAFAAELKEQQKNKKAV